MADERHNERRWVVDDDGYQGCQVCGQTVQGTEWCQLQAVRVADPGGWTHRWWFDEEDPIPRVDDTDREGPVLHIDCVDVYLRGILSETVAERKAAGD